MHRAPLQSLALVNTLSQLGRDLERDVTVEGVEDHGILEAVRILGLRYAQGYGIARPMHPSELLPWWAARRVQDPAPGVSAVTTALGALAYQWHGSRSTAAVCTQPLAQCPLTAFIANLGDAGSALGKAHSELHCAPQNPALSHRLTRLLLALVDQGTSDLDQTKRGSE